jgi:hypothetical protein
MCSAIEDSIHARYVQAVLKDIASVQCGAKEEIEEETEAWIYKIQRSGVWFEGKFGQGQGSKVSLNQFRFALGAYLQFLRDPQRQQLKMLFPAA